MFDIDWRSLVVPALYILALSSTYLTFTTIYHKRKAAESANLEPWFPPHLQRNVYLSLLHMEPEDGSEKKPKVPDSILRAALLRRAVEDIQRIVQVRTSKAACSALLQRGSVGDSLWQRFLRAEKEMEIEIREVVVEANALSPNWGNTIFQSANEMAGNMMFRKNLEDIQGKLESEKAKWGGKAATAAVKQPEALPTAGAVTSPEVGDVSMVSDVGELGPESPAVGGKKKLKAKK